VPGIWCASPAAISFHQKVREMTVNPASASASRDLARHREVGRGVVVAFVPDLGDRSRIAGVGEALGVEVRFVSRLTELDAASLIEASLLLIDLTRPGALQVPARRPNLASIGFAPHVDRGLHRAARLEGCGEVLARSVFFRRLPQILRTVPRTAPDRAGQTGEPTARTARTEVASSPQTTRPNPDGGRELRQS
jgi:hypothetical protein